MPMPSTARNPALAHGRTRRQAPKPDPLCPARNRRGVRPLVRPSAGVCARHSQRVANVARHAQRVIDAHERVFEQGPCGSPSIFSYSSNVNASPGGIWRPALRSSTAFWMARVTRKMTVEGYSTSSTPSRASPLGSFHGVRPPPSRMLVRQGAPRTSRPPSPAARSSPPPRCRPRWRRRSGTARPGALPRRAERRERVGPGDDEGLRVVASSRRGAQLRGVSLCADHSFSQQVAAALRRQLVLEEIAEAPIAS